MQAILKYIHIKMEKMKNKNNGKITCKSLQQSTQQVVKTLQYNNVFGT